MGKIDGEREKRRERMVEGGRTLRMGNGERDKSEAERKTEKKSERQMSWMRDRGRQRERG